jgi:hypothetical protein
MGRAMIKDNPTRTASPDARLSRPYFADLPLPERLDIINEPRFCIAVEEAIFTSPEYETWLRQLTDSTVSDADVGRAAREIVCAYVGEVAEHRGEGL